MSTIKKKQHYIWKHYLNSWVSDNKIWCKRNGKCFQTNLDNVGQKRFFYKAEQLNKSELNVVEKIIASMHPSTHESHYSTLGVYILSSMGGEATQKNALEEYHTRIEHSAIDIVALLLKKDLSWLENDTSKINFSHFLGVQYTRTNRSQSSMSNGLSLVSEEYPKYKGQLNPEKVAKVIAMLMGNVIGSWIYSSGKFSLIENNTNLDFITGDQPVFNLDMKLKREFEPAKDFNLYYPLSPNLALLVSKEAHINEEVSLEEVAKYNDFIALSSQEQIYSKQKESLTKYD